MDDRSSSDASSRFNSIPDSSENSDAVQRSADVVRAPELKAVRQEVVEDILKALGIDLDDEVLNEEEDYKDLQVAA